MKLLLIPAAVLALSASAVTAADDPIAVRQALMQANAGAAGLSGAMLKGELDYNPAVAKAAIATFNAVASSYGHYFPEGSEGNGETTASPKIWEDMAGFQEAVGKFETDAAGAVEASGKDGPADLDTFKAAVGPVLGNCKSCHESFRVQDN
ncbi:c-type cytochrome [Mesorhizobium xinjiangense]|uniref:c-type cytochrome n=1 Tax=Mesorhizobium xinjiangense TaxID=2678685 RepID=UPI0012ED0489|nr:cytochrome c [Mesorhizobium xinjiangense]